MSEAMRLGPRAAGAAYQPPMHTREVAPGPTGPRRVVPEAYVVGLVVGGPRDPSGLVVLERVVNEAPLGPVWHELRHLIRWPAGTPYHAVAEAVLTLATTPSLQREERDRVRLGLAAIVCERSGVGRLTVALLARLDPRLPVVSVAAGGERMDQDPEGWHVPAGDLAENLNTLERAGRLELGYPTDFGEGPELERQRGALRLDRSPTGRDRYEPEPGQATDLVRALLLAAWWGEVASPAREATLPDPYFSWSSPEARAIEYERLTRVKPILPPPSRYNDWTQEDVL